MDLALTVPALLFPRSASSTCPELGHVFGLRHYFADTLEREWPSVLFGAHRKFSIMNNGVDSMLTEQDIENLGGTAFRLFGSKVI